MENDKNPENGSRISFNWLILGGAALDFGFYLLLPLLIAVFLGQKIEDFTGSKVYTIVFILLALFVSTFLIYRKLKVIADQLKRK